LCRFLLAVLTLQTMDPVALEALAKQVGEKRKADAAPAAGALSAPSTLSEIHSNASALNAANPEVLQAVLGAGEAGGAALKSDADEQLLVSLNLPQTFKLSAIKIAGPADGSAPATIKLFANKQSMSFDDCEDFCPTQTLTLSSAEATIPLQLTKFSNVSSLSVFIETNQGDEEFTQLTSLSLVGVPVHTTNMNDLKKSG